MVVEDLPDVPPAAVLLYSEVYAKAEGWEDARKRLKSLLPELKAQSRAYDLARFEVENAPPSPKEFDIHLDGALNLFSKDSGGCMDTDCRVVAAERLARSVGLVADRLWVTDYLTETFCDFGRATDAKLDLAVADTLVLGTLMPLVAGGVMRFKSPWIPSCQSCLNHFEDQVSQITDDLVAAFHGEFMMEHMGENRYALHTGAVFDPPIVLRILPGRKTSDAPPNADNYIWDVIHGAVRSALWVGREAAVGRGSVFSNSRVGLAGLVHREGRFTGLKQFQALDDSRNFELPWIGELTPAQVVELRAEASKAMPQFREVMASRLVYDEDGPSGGSADVVAELREQAAEVRAELEIINRQAKRFWKKPFTLLSLSAAALGVATDQTIGAAGGLLALWQFLGEHDEGNEKDAEKLKSRPGYVLLKAKDLLAHAH